MRLRQLPERTAAKAHHAQRVDRHPDGRSLADLQDNQGGRQGTRHGARRSGGTTRCPVVCARRASDGTDLERQRKGGGFSCCPILLIQPQTFQVAAAFGWGGKAFTDNIGSVQVLSELPDQVRGFDYSWRNFKEAAIFDKSKKEWWPVHVDSVKGLLGDELLMANFNFPQTSSR